MLSGVKPRGSDRANHEEAIERYHELALNRPVEKPRQRVVPILAKDLANRFLATQQANWRSRDATLRGYRDWLRRFLEDHPRLVAQDFTVERFAAWKLSLIDRGYSSESINHYLGAVRAIYRFAEDVDLLEQSPRLTRVKNAASTNRDAKPLCSQGQLKQLLDSADVNVRAMILLCLNCGFGPKDLSDLQWRHFKDNRVTLARTKTGIGQSFTLWPETIEAVENVRKERRALIARLAKRGRLRADEGSFLVTKYWRPWDKNSIAGQFRKLCKAVSVPCYGIYRLRHCASTAMSLVASPHVHRKFMRHSQLQQQVAYTHTPDVEVDHALERTRLKLLPGASEDVESGPQ